MFHSPLLAVIIALFLIWCLCIALRGAWSYCPDDEITTTTITEREDPVLPLVAGNLRRRFSEGENEPQAYVIDPADSKKIFINDNDDMYEDAAGKMWRLV